MNLHSDHLIIKKALSILFLFSLAFFVGHFAGFLSTYFFSVPDQAAITPTDARIHSSAEGNWGTQLSRRRQKLQLVNANYD